MKVTLDIVQVYKKFFALENVYHWAEPRGGVHDCEQQQLLLQQPKPPRSPVL